MLIPSVGRIVHYVLPEGAGRGHDRPAVIVRVWEEHPTHRSAVNLMVFTDSMNDGLPEIYWQTSRYQDDGHEFGTWHEPERYE